MTFSEEVYHAILNRFPCTKWEIVSNIIADRIKNGIQVSNYAHILIFNRLKYFLRDNHARPHIYKFLVPHKSNSIRDPYIVLPLNDIDPFLLKDIRRDSTTSGMVSCLKHELKQAENSVLSIQLHIQYESVPSKRKILSEVLIERQNTANHVRLLLEKAAA